MKRENLPYFFAFVLFGMACYFTGALLNPKIEAPQIERMVALPACEYRLDNIRVIDGDTIEADILFPLGVTLRDEYIRFVDYDAWESSKRRRSVNVTDAEVLKGKKATEDLISLANSSEFFTLLLDDGARDVYGRVLGRAVVYSADGTRVELVDYMSQKGHIRHGDQSPAKSN